MTESDNFPTPEELSQLRHNCEYHREVACMVNGGQVVALLDELERLRDINHRLVCSHNDLLIVTARLEAGQPPLSAWCACRSPSLPNVAHRSHECLVIGRQPIHV